MKETEKTVRVAAYCRLSRDDGDRVESDSIINQRRIIEDFCRHQENFEIIAEYADDGFTGTSFNRPRFNDMISDIEAGMIDCVVVKDLSRFGRDYIDMGFYLERFFPEHGIRFIAINDNVDSDNGPYDMMLPLKNVFNSQYARDTSDKVRKAFRAKQARGEYVSAFAPYGYIKDPADKNHFLVDRDTAAIVQRIFERAADGESYRKIAKDLNAEGIASPLEHKRENGSRLHIPGAVLQKSLWSDAAIRQVITNEIYIGNMVSNRYTTDTMHGKSRRTGREEWIIVEGTHEAIITRELWDAAQKRQTHGFAQPQKTRYLFAGLVRCGECGCAMKGHRRDHYISYRCYSRVQYGACSTPSISERKLIEIVLRDLNQIISRISDLSALRQPEKSVTSVHAVDTKRISAAIKRLQHQKQKAYEDYRAGALTRDEFLECKRSFDEQERALEQEISKENTTSEMMEKNSDAWAEKLIRLGQLDELDRLTLEQTIEGIRIFRDGRIEIAYQFSEEMKYDLN